MVVLMVPAGIEIANQSCWVGSNPTCTFLLIGFFALMFLVLYWTRPKKEEPTKLFFDNINKGC